MTMTMITLKQVAEIKRLIEEALCGEIDVTKGEAQRALNCGNEIKDGFITSSAERR
jgi:hypothetical protein